MEKLDGIASGVHCDDKKFYDLLSFLERSSNCAISPDEPSLLSMEKFSLLCLNDKNVLFDILSKCHDLSLPIFSQCQRKRFLLLALRSALALDCVEDVICVLKENLFNQIPSLYNTFVLFIYQLTAASSKRHAGFLELIEDIEKVSDTKLLALYVLANLSCDKALMLHPEIKQRLEQQISTIANLSSQTVTLKKHNGKPEPSKKNQKKKLRRRKLYLEKLSKKNGGAIPPQKAKPLDQWTPKPKKKIGKKKTYKKPNAATK